MESWNLSDFMMNEEVSVQFVFPLFQIQRFVRCTRQESLKTVLMKLVEMDEFLKQFEFDLIFDRTGRRLDFNCMICNFGELEWIQVFVM